MESTNPENNLETSEVKREAEIRETPLMLAVRSQKLRIVELLILYGAELNAENAKGQTAMMIAQELGYSEIELLLKSQMNLIPHDEATKNLPQESSEEYVAPLRFFVDDATREETTKEKTPKKPGPANT